MVFRPRIPSQVQSGIVLVSSLLLLLVVTIMALSIFRSFGVQEKIAGNSRDKQRALQAAVSTQQYAESWLITSSNAVPAVNAGAAPSADVICGSAPLAPPQICSNPPPVAITAVPWNFGAQYAPLNMGYGSNGTTVVAAPAPITDVYYGKPGFYITDLGTVASANGEVYRIDAYSYGVSQSTVAVVESTVAITCIVCNLGGGA